MKLKVDDGVEEKERIYQLGRIIYSLNLIEEDFKEIICLYTNSSKSDFVNRILLNNSIINFSQKFKIIQYIVEKIDFFKECTKEEFIEFNDCFNILMGLRNQVAHTDTVIYSEQEHMDNYFGVPFQTWIAKKLHTSTIKDGKISELSFSDVIKNFEKYFKKSKFYLTKLKKEVNKHNYLNEKN